MRIAIVATLLFAPLLLNAQTTQQGVSASAPKTNETMMATAADSNLTDLTAPVTVSTGVVAPRLMDATSLELQDAHTFGFALEHRVVVDLTVEENGRPSDIAILHPSDKRLDEAVVASVSQYRFKPGTIDNQAIAVPMRLTVVIRGSFR